MNETLNTLLISLVALPCSDELQSKKLETIQNLLDLGADINSRNEEGEIHIGDMEVLEGETPLVAACNAKFVDIKLVSFLLERGADPNKDDTSVFTPLITVITNIYCQDNDRAKAVKLLLEYGADPNKVSIEEFSNEDINITPFTVALNCSSLEVSINIEILKLLLEYRANVHTPIDGKTIFELLEDDFAEEERELLNLLTTYK